MIDNSVRFLLAHAEVVAQESVPCLLRLCSVYCAV